MSIETERWKAAGYYVLPDGERPEDARVENIAEACSASRARAIAVLPEALALLKELEANPGGVDGGMERARDILRRAGVLGA